MLARLTKRGNSQALTLHDLATPQEFMDALRNFDKRSLWQETLDPELHWSDRLHQSSTTGNLIHLKIRTEEQRHRQIDCLHSGTH